ncbi:phytanoyl-CoA dioxygenase family protein [Paenibacillus flagellatus]|uniref:Phytanoyl-CoA dioxygenase family protein n=1 Tax=Paenibacillus flagellatus TaxID=2211139 RepID=A0A2V5K5D2_9BACL|nr:phytanoyl-CoA dioxygenase family protein [Paenibacillus flagellatus]PYI54585.1 phytanoyl-CoA dioxygenase family protein [Paenibacillus flagellatus]
MIKADDVQFYKDTGYLLVKGVFSREEVEEMRRAVDGIVDRAAKAKNVAQSHTWQGDYLPPEELKKLVLKGFHDVHYQDAAFTRAVCHPNMTAIVSKLIGPNVQLHHSKMLVKPPEKGAAFPLHQDHPYFPHANHTMMAASVHMDDADMDNGCLCVIPGSHKLGPIPHVGRHYLDHRDYPLSSATPCPAQAGDVLFFNYLTIHGSDVNRSDRPRRNVLFQYRDPSDPPTNDDHVNWGQGLMICGENPQYREYKAEYRLKA